MTEKFRSILVVHNFYQQPGGEDQVFYAETSLLERHGHRVHRYTISNESVPEYGYLNLFFSTIWNKRIADEVVKIARESDAEIVHFHNTFPLISPAAYYSIRSLGVPVVQTLHNYRLLCPNALFYRDGKPCEDCLGKLIPLPGVYHKCYREDRLASLTIASMLGVHRMMHTWTSQVDLFIALTDFARHKFIQGGIPEKKIIIKPNFIHPDPGMGDGNGDCFLYAGRLSPEKGIENLIEVWTRLGAEYRLKIIGDGPLAPLVRAASERMPNIEWLGKMEKIDVVDHMKRSRALIFPSTCYEGFPLVIAESFAVGLPVFSSDIGSMSSINKDKKTGLLCRSDDVSDWVNKIKWMQDQPEVWKKMGLEARREFENKYSSEINYKLLIGAYESASIHSRQIRKRET